MQSGLDNCFPPAHSYLLPLSSSISSLSLLFSPCPHQFYRSYNAYVLPFCFRSLPASRCLVAAKLSMALMCDVFVKIIMQHTLTRTYTHYQSVCLNSLSLAERAVFEVSPHS